MAPSVIGSVEGPYSLSAVVTDNHGLNAASVTDQPLTVLPNEAPTVGAVQVPTGTVTLGNTVTLSVTAGGDGTIASVNFYNGTITSTGNTYTLAWTPSVEGPVSAVVTDNNGLNAASVTDQPVPNEAPTVGAVQVIADEVPVGATVLLAATAGMAPSPVLISIMVAFC